MAEKAYSGLTASILINDNLLGYMSNVELNLEKDIIDVVQFGSQYKEKIPSIKDWSASSDGTVAFVPGGSQHKLYQAYESGEEITLKIKLDDFTYFEGQAYISSLKIDGAPDDKLNISVEFAGSNAITFTLPATVIVTISSGVGGTTDKAGQIKIAKSEGLTITTIPAAGKVADKYYIDDETAGTAISDNTVTLTPDQTDADVKVRITFKNATT
jgi:predicted secreted protein